MLHKYLLSAFEIRINRSSNEVFLSHNVTDLDIFKISDKSKISVSEDTLKLAILIDYSTPEILYLPMSLSASATVLSL